MSAPAVFGFTHTWDARGVHTLCLNRPEAFNVLSSQVMQSLQDVLVRVGQDPQARVVVLTHEGKAFCSGHDLREMQAMASQAEFETLFAQCTRMMTAVQQLPVPVIVVVDGVATAAGCQLVAMCDLAIASVASQFAVSGVRLGLFCSTPSVALSRNLSRKAAFEMLVTGDFVSAEQALTKGLLNAVVPAQDLADEVARYVDSILAKPRHALAMGKKLFYAQLEQPLDRAYQSAERVMAENMMDPATREGVQAFLEKRKPQW